MCSEKYNDKSLSDVRRRFWENGVSIDIPARHSSDGMLRVLAILTQLSTEYGFILFDEIENGINPELIEKLMDTLVDASRQNLQQIMVTTHSPMILNYLEDEVAEESVILIYKTPEGLTRNKRFFEIPMLKEKLQIMGPGEAFADTHLVDLVKKLNENSQE